MPVWPCEIQFRTTQDDLRKDGPLMPASWKSNSPNDSQRIDGALLLDTGASGFMIDDSVAKLLKLEVLSEYEIHGAHGFGKSRRYIANLLIPVKDARGQEILLQIPAECSEIPDLCKNYEMKGRKVIGVLGRNFLQFANIAIDGPSGSVRVSISKEILEPRN